MAIISQIIGVAVIVTMIVFGVKYVLSNFTKKKENEGE